MAKRKRSLMRLEQYLAGAHTSRYSWEDLAQALSNALAAASENAHDMRSGGGEDSGILEQAANDLQCVADRLAALSIFCAVMPDGAGGVVLDQEEHWPSSSIEGRECWFCGPDDFGARTDSASK